MAGNLSALALGGDPPTKAVLNAFSSGSVSVANLTASATTNMAKEYLSGALTSGVLATPTGLSLTGPGQAALLVAYSKDATARTIRLQVTVDGTVVFDATSNSVSAAGSGLVAAGKADSVAFGASNPIRWASSLVVKVATSVASETDKVAVGIAVN